MKSKNKSKKAEETYKIKPFEPLSFKDELNVNDVPAPESMVRTQVYLTKREHEFLQFEAEQLGEPMSAFLRRIVDERMKVPDSAWRENAMLEPTPEDPEWKGIADGSINHDHYVYGGPKKYEERKGKWVLLPPLDA